MESQESLFFKLNAACICPAIPKPRHAGSTGDIEIGITFYSKFVLNLCC